MLVLAMQFSKATPRPMQRLEAAVRRGPEHELDGDGARSAGEHARAAEESREAASSKQSSEDRRHERLGGAGDGPAAELRRAAAGWCTRVEMDP